MKTNQTQFFFWVGFCRMNYDLLQQVTANKMSTLSRNLGKNISTALETQLTCDEVCPTYWRQLNPVESFV